MVEKSHWTGITEENPDHSAWCIQRSKDMEAEERDLGSEARLANGNVITFLAPATGQSVGV